MFKIESGTLLFRCAISSEIKPKPRYCSDTEKIGVYFTDNIKLAELMLLEHYESSSIDTEFITMYITTEDIIVYGGKYACKSGSHYDSKCIYPIVKNELYEKICFETISKSDVAEIFLDPIDVEKIEYKACWTVSVKNVLETYTRH